eukprot:GHVN01055508.1.p1 GENE.GHVN01055508.1~~GHVN01055508.1.p1  ORF type:complete len:968 (+),score=193.32 GHVN01055508.1:474-3377(+)
MRSFYILFLALAIVVTPQYVGCEDAIEEVPALVEGIDEVTTTKGEAQGDAPIEEGATASLINKEIAGDTSDDPAVKEAAPTEDTKTEKYGDLSDIPGIVGTPDLPLDPENALGDFDFANMAKLMGMDGMPDSGIGEDEEEPTEVGRPVSKADAGLNYGELTEEQQEAMKTAAEPHMFQAEVERMMGIIINSLYSDKDIFLRELISNSADALEKIRFLSLTDETSLGDNKELEIRITYDKEGHTLTVADTGIGMTKQDLINNLGTVAKSGTSNFLESLSQGGDANLVGQFGVGFYSAFLVADRVTVISKNNEDKQHIWESTADAQFTVTEDPRGSTLGRGTLVILHLKPDATDYASSPKLKEIVKRYSQFISHPIYLAVDRKKTVEEEEVDEEGEAGENGDKPKKKVQKTVDYKVWEAQNSQKAIWMRPKEEISNEEYTEFYKAISRDRSAPFGHIHFAAEGEVEFRSILYIPKKASANAWGDYFDKESGVKLYVRRVLVSDTATELLPKYLTWMRGVVDSDDLPLKVDREQLSSSKVLTSIKGKLVRKALELMKRLSNEDEKEKEKARAEAKEKGEEWKPKSSDYERFLDAFGRNLKLGCSDDDTNRNKIIKLMRFYSLRTPTELISIDKYIEMMGSNEHIIYYMASESVESSLRSPLIKSFIKKGLNVLFLIDPTDESCISRVNDIEGKKFASIQKANLDLSEGEDAKKRHKKLVTLYEPLTRFWKDAVGYGVQKVVLSSRPIEDPCVVVGGEHAYSAYMEKVLKTQTFANNAQLSMMTAMKVLELNPSHPVIQQMLEKVNDGEGDDLRAMARSLWGAAMIAGGFDVQGEQAQDVSAFVYGTLAQKMGVGTDLVEPLLPAEEDEKEEEEEGEDIDVDEEGTVENSPAATEVSETQGIESGKAGQTGTTGDTDTLEATQTGDDGEVAAEATAEAGKKENHGEEGTKESSEELKKEENEPVEEEKAEL